MQGAYFKPSPFAWRKSRPGVRDGYCNRLALWSAANLAGMETGTLVIREPFLRRILNKIIGRRRRRILRVRRPARQHSLPMLAKAVVGLSKSSIHSVFGPPRGAVLSGRKSGGGITFWESSIWYYPVPRDGFIAMSIIFDEDIAMAVQFFESPVHAMENRTAA